ncbi:MAG: aldo/keto reductase [Saprospiraceae bacterium]|nr:aldo/keto reductase [Saprospiraceae bacterium]MBK7524049.1 aldo/keto reductase [Saprospiraceae bacterium]MBK8547371.1 aldo/keto reductase [Saprospiraceae bacterium]MBK8852713.1 aldo/keto reductase [Saprospiraceae bacterium]MBK9042359.1 aldo/keto reductase [Saprospiraceae bacterium]
MSNFSRVIAGTIRWGSWGAKLSPTKMAELMNACLDTGVTTFDLADVYGNYTTEREFGDALILSGIQREKIQLIGKSGIIKPCAEKPGFIISHYNTSKRHIIETVEACLENLNSSYLDVYMVHRGSPMLDFEEISEALQILHESGKVKSFGVSDFSHTQIHAMQKYFPVASAQMEYSMLHHQCMYNGVLDVCMENKITPISWAPLAGDVIFTTSKTGKKRYEKLEALAEKYEWTVTEMALLFLLHHPAKIHPIVSAPKINKIKEFTDLLEIKITNEQWFDILRTIRGEEVS